jgi:hypothetical protein
LLEEALKDLPLFFCGNTIEILLPITYIIVRVLLIAGEFERELLQ